MELHFLVITMSVSVSLCSRQAKVSTSSPIHPQVVGQCGVEYKEPTELLWLMNVVDIKCLEGVACKYSIVSPSGTGIRLNFTHLTVSDRNTTILNTSYSLVEGDVKCQPKIEVMEKLEHAEENQRVVPKRSLCYNDIPSGSSVLINLMSKEVEVAMYCVPFKYSIFSINFNFFPLPGDCEGPLSCPCLPLHQLCNGIVDCNDGADERSCNHSAVAQSYLDPSTDKLDRSNHFLVAVTLMVVGLLLLLFLVLSAMCICRRHRGFNHNDSRCHARAHYPVLGCCWRDRESILVTEATGAVPAATQQLLQHPGIERSQGKEFHHTDDEFEHAAASQTEMEQHKKNQLALDQIYEYGRVTRSSDGDHGYKQYRSKLSDARRVQSRSDTVSIPPNKTLEEFKMGGNPKSNSANNCSCSRGELLSSPSYSRHRTADNRLPTYDMVVNGDH